MLTMTEIDDIRDGYYKKGKSINEIAKKFDKDRKTVRKYVRKEDFNRTRKESTTGTGSCRGFPRRGFPGFRPAMYYLLWGTSPGTVTVTLPSPASVQKNTRRALS
jgi:hypothetical protein